MSDPAAHTTPHHGTSMTTTAKAIDDFEVLLNGLLDDTLSEADEQRLATILASNAEARRRYRHWMELHAALEWDYAAAAMPMMHPAVESNSDSPADQISRKPARAAAWRGIIMASSLASLAAAVVAAGWLGARWMAADRPSVEIIAVGGAASWSGNGEVLTDLAVGDRLRDGLVSLEGASTFMGMRFHDGTAVTLVGDSILEYGDRGQKHLTLRHGSLSVDARPQPAGKPMLIRTPTAEVEVIGTVFSISADATETQLGVEQGSVRVRRLADGDVVQVPKNQVVTASLDAAAPLAVSTPLPMATDFRQTFDLPPALKLEGQWLPAADVVPSRVRALPRIAGRWPNGAPIIHHGMSLHAPDSGFVAFQPESVVSVRCRMAMPETLRVMLNMRRPEGTFAGNFEAKVPFVPAESPADADGWRTVEIPAASFLPIIDLHPRFTPGMVVSLLLVETFKSEAGLEVAEIRVHSGSR